MKRIKNILKIVLSVILLGIIVWYFYVHFIALKPLQIQTTDQVVHYRVEQALTKKEQEKGLMHRRHLPPRTGMIFLFHPIRIAHMWMKNTLIPLDMVFFDKTGRVVLVHQNAKPHDLTIISSGRPVAGVLEINAGEAQKFNIRVGSKLDLKAFK